MALRFRYLEPRIPLGYDSLVEAINKAIDKQKELDGATVVDKVESRVEEEMTFDQIRAEAQELWTTLVGAAEENADKILKKVEMTFGRKMKLSDITEDQKDLFFLVLLDMREMNSAL